ncbi:hypothetical protein [Mangrovibacterium lignilyticum]|uniref:hypothetical protein n=1 Tax=Mangrovibacterium lignilyticum TaxID=2668052 RepID=UPI0013D74465|nr:hypothetical protein [Mangrovibacterium lignilyticum]
MKKLFLLAIVSVFLFASCEVEDSDPGMTGKFQGKIASLLIHGEYTIDGSRCATIKVTAGATDNEIIFNDYYGAAIRAILVNSSFTIPTQEVTYEGITYSISGSGYTTKDGMYFSSSAIFYVEGVLWEKSESGDLSKL